MCQALLQTGRRREEHDEQEAGWGRGLLRGERAMSELSPSSPGSVQS